MSAALPIPPIRSGRPDSGRGAGAPPPALPRPGARRRRPVPDLDPPVTRCRPIRTSTRTPTSSPASCSRRPARRGSCRRTPTAWWARCGSAPPDGRFYPKYPLGETLLVAATVKAFGLRAAYLVNPLLMALALLGVFLLVRDAAGSPPACSAMLMMAAEPGGARRDQRSRQPRRLARLHRLGDVPAAALVADGEARRRGARRPPARLLDDRPLHRGAAAAAAPAWSCSSGSAAAVGAPRRSRAVAALLAGWAAADRRPGGVQPARAAPLTGYDATHESTAFSPATSPTTGADGAPALHPRAAAPAPPGRARPRCSSPGRSAGWGSCCGRGCCRTSCSTRPTTGRSKRRRQLPALLPLRLPAAGAGDGLAADPAAAGSGWLRRWGQPAVALALVLACGAYGAREIAPLLASDPRRPPGGPRGGGGGARHGSAGLGDSSGRRTRSSHLQYVGTDFRLYSRTLFVRRAIQELGEIDPKRPNAFQPERAQALFRAPRRR